MQDRRKRTRIAGKNWLAVKVLSVPGLEGAAARTVFCATEDIGNGGLQVVALEPIPVGARVQINLAVTNPVSSFLHVGTVRWSRRDAAGGKHRVGIEFTHTAPAVMDAWQRHVKAQASGPRKTEGPAGLP